MKNKITFKADRPTGKWRAFEETQHLIKLNGNHIGQIHQSLTGIGFYIMIAVYKTNEVLNDGNENCPWVNIKLKYRSNSFNEIKEWIVNNIDKIAHKYFIHNFED